MSSTPIRRFHRVANTALVRLAAIALVMCIAACASRAPAPIEDRASRPAPPSAAPAPPPPPAANEADGRSAGYTVKRGDTLRSIALDHGLDYRDLAAWNNIDNLNVIRVGQVLRLAPPGDAGQAGAPGVVTAPLRSVPPVVAGGASAEPPPPSAPVRNTDNYKSQPKIVKEPYSEQALRDVQQSAAAPPAPPTATLPTAPTAPLPAAPPAPPAASAPAAPEPAPPAAVASLDRKPSTASDADDEKVEWAWPAKGKVVAGFSEASSLKGIDIAGTAGQSIAASASGKVVYAGSGLRGYGKLIIIKHNGTFLSAYAHNRDIVVKEGQQVTRGQKIAEMGSTDADQVKLHFEIRRHGKPMDPLRYLPPA